MKLHRTTLIAALDAQIAADRTAIDAANVVIREKNAAAQAEWDAKRVSLGQAARQFAKLLNAKSFDGNVRNAEHDAMASAGFTSRWSRPDLEFGSYNAPKPQPAKEHGTTYPALRELLAAGDEEFVTVSALERMGFKSANLATLYRTLYRAQVAA